MAFSWCQSFHHQSFQTCLCSSDLTDGGKEIWDLMIQRAQNSTSLRYSYHNKQIHDTKVARHEI